MPRGKRGRPPLPPDQRLSEWVGLRFRPCELADLEERAAEIGTPLSRYLRDACLRRRREPLPPKVPEINETTAAEIRKWGANLNQIARRLNSGAAPESAKEDLHQIRLGIIEVLERLKGR